MMCSIQENLFKQICCLINKSIEENKPFINTKRIRRELKISSKDHSSINYIWRNLKLLQEESIIKLYPEASNTLYEVNNKKITEKQILKLIQNFREKN